MSTAPAQSVGDLLREWRQRRRMSQLDLASEADVSTRHLSFLETGRSLPSREMLLHLAEQLEIPLRERNVLITDAGLLSFFCTTTIFGTPVEIILSELAIESFYPADAATAGTMRRFAEGQAAQ